MSVVSFQIAQAYLLQKAVWITKHLLNAGVTEFNDDQGLTGDRAVPFPRSINPSNTIELFGTNSSIDGFPALNIYETSNTIVSRDFTSTQDHDIALTVMASVMCDSADVPWASNQARALASIAANCLEQYLCDPYVQVGATDVYSIYRTDMSSGASGGIQPLKNNMMVAAFACQLRVRMRSTYSVGRSLMRTDALTPAFQVQPYVQSNFNVPTAFIQLSSQLSVQDLPPDSPTAITFTAAQKAASTSTIIEIPNMPDGAVAYVTNQKNFTAIRRVQAGNVITILFSEITSLSGELWTIDVIHPTNKVLCSYTVIWEMIA